MKYWDTSALMPLIVDEPRSQSMTEMLRQDERVVTWWGTLVECASGLALRRRKGDLAQEAHEQALVKIGVAFRGWRVVEPNDSLRYQAMVLTRLHGLRAGDALQLAAALDWADRPGGVPFVCLDGRLREAASLQGFAVLPS